MLNIKDLKAQYITDEAGKKTAVILSIEDFEELLADIKDLAVIAERQSERTVSHTEIIENLKRDELI